MSVSIVVPNINFTKFFANSLPKVFTGAVGYYLFGGSQADSVKNRALNPTVANATLVGSPTFGAGFSTIPAGTGVGFNTGLASGSSYTYVAVVNAKGGDAMLAGAWTNAGRKNAMAFTASGLTYAANGLWQSATTIANARQTGFAFYAMTVDGTTVTMYAHNGTQLVSKTTLNSVQTSGSPVEIGVAGGSIGGSELDFASSVVYNRALTQAEITDLYKHFKTLMPTRGITMI